MSQRLAQGGPELGRVLHGPGFDAKGAGHGGVVGAPEIHVVEALAEACVLARLDPAEGGVREDEAGHGHVVPDERLELSAGEAERAVAHQRHDRRLGAAHLCAHGGGERVAERTVGPVGDEVATRFGPAVVGGDVGAGRARVCDDDGLIREHVLEGGDHRLGADRAFGALGQRVEGGAFGLPGPGGAGGAVLGVHLAALNFREERFEREAGIGGDGDGGVVVRADHLRVAVDVDHGHRPGRGRASARW